MELTPELAIIHQPVRLKIMGLLYKQRDVGFTAARDALGLSDGNLASHANKLAEAGLLDARKVLTREGFEMRYRLTEEGSRQFRLYLEQLERFLVNAYLPAEVSRSG